MKQDNSSNKEKLLFIGDSVYKTVNCVDSIVAMALVVRMDIIVHFS